MEECSDEELNERHKEITNQLELADTEDLETQKKELEEDFERHRQEFERHRQEHERKMSELSQKQADKRRLEEEELLIGFELEKRNKAKQLELETQRQALAERRSRIRSKSLGRPEVGLEEARSRSGARLELELEEVTSWQDLVGGEDEEDSGFQNVVFSQVRRIFSSAAILTISMNIPGAKKSFL